MQSIVQSSWLRGISMIIFIKLDKAFKCHPQYMTNLTHMIPMFHRVRYELRCLHPHTEKMSSLK